jgi:hypothetical protein
MACAFLHPRQVIASCPSRKNVEIFPASIWTLKSDCDYKRAGMAADVAKPKEVWPSGLRL